MVTLPVMQNISTRTLIIHAWKAGVESVGGERVTRAAIAEDRINPILHLLAVGKAASAMCVGALDCFAENARALVVTKYGHCDDAIAAHPRITVIESGHPLPDENSLRAGRAMVEFVGAVAAQQELVMLISGGASALAEVLSHDINLAALREVNQQLLASGCSIEEVNVERARLSSIKSGKLLSRFGGKSVRVYAISDVLSDSIDLIGGGVGAINWSTSTAKVPAYHAKIIASNRIARDAAAEFLRARGMKIIVNQESLYKDIHVAAQQIAAALLDGAAGAYIWGGEPTVVLPPKPGIGGRNQSLALAVAEAIRGWKKIAVLVAGTDGTDGPTNAAGGLVDGDTFNAASGASHALQKANAGTYLARIAALFKPGPTGTNVMDLVIAIKQ